jgi:PAS domain S-box-containing protein
MKPGFLERLLKRLDRLSPAEVQPYLLRLVQEQGFFTKVFEALQEGLILLDKDHVVTYVNHAACEFFGLQRDTVLGSRLSDSVRELDLDSIKKTGGSISRNIEITYPEPRWLNFYFSSIGDDDELGFVVLIRDITETRKVTEDRIESDRISTLTLLAAGVAHELGNPLNSLMIHLQLLERRIQKLKSKEAGVLLEMLRVPQDEVRRLDQMIGRFLGAIRPSRPVLRPEDLNELLRQSIDFLRPEIEAADVRLGLNLDAGLPRMHLDAEQMKQVFYNLIRNAVQAMPGGGQLTITTNRTPSEVQIVFADSGKGIQPDELGNLFRPFFTTRSGGTGLGLLIVRRIIREHGGEIEIRSGGKRGTIVCCSLPYLHQPPPLLIGGSP